MVFDTVLCCVELGLGLQATLSKLLTYCVLRPTQPPTVNGTENESSSPIVGYMVVKT